ncbi:MAG TPA: heavy-metal-associated domain-containing protein [Pyrinomonadaceae bacterium]|nr:heavy-metal-associated domain-containing protein [Pyrinomonadaceae bacterium]
MQKRQAIALLVLALILSSGAASVFAAGKTTTIHIQGMHCKMCAASVAKALKATTGVETVEVSFERSEAVIQYDDQKVTEARLREVINSTGFKAVEESNTSGNSTD